LLSWPASYRPLISSVIGYSVLTQLLMARDPAVIFTRISHADLKVKVFPQVTTLNYGLNVVTADKGKFRIRS
jgi:hypothetical protein